MASGGQESQATRGPSDRLRTRVGDEVQEPARNATCNSSTREEISSSSQSAPSTSPQSPPSLLLPPPPTPAERSSAPPHVPLPLHLLPLLPFSRVPLTSPAANPVSCPSCCTTFRRTDARHGDQGGTSSGCTRMPRRRRRQRQQGSTRDGSTCCPRDCAGGLGSASRALGVAARLAACEPRALVSAQLAVPSTVE